MRIKLPNSSAPPGRWRPVQRWRRVLALLLLPPALLASCGSVLQGPVFGSIALERAADAADAVVFLRCRGPGIHGEIETDAEDTRVGADGRFSFAGSLTFPTTERCYLDVRHPRYLTARVYLEDRLIQKLDPISLQSWDDFLAAGPSYELNPGTHRPWPASELYRQLSDTWMWLGTFGPRDQQRMARYVPDLHRIFAASRTALAGTHTQMKGMLDMLSRIEDTTAYPYPLKAYRQAVESGDAVTVEAFIAGGVLRHGQGSMLYLAASKGHLAVIDALLKHDEPLNIPGCGAPLLGAISQRQWPAALKLLRAGADVDPGCPRHHRGVGDVLSDSARGGQLDLLRQFLDAGVAVDLRNSNGTTALAEATARQQLQAVKILLAAGANANEQTAEGLPLITVARQNGSLDIERELQRALLGEDAPPTQAAGGGRLVPLAWRLGQQQPYTVHTSFGQILNMAADPQRPGVLWLATWGGLLQVEPSTGQRRAWTMAEGLPAGTVYNLWFDPAGEYLWLATGSGLARLPLDDLARIEQMNDKQLRSSVYSGFLPGATVGEAWYWNADGLYRLEVENSRALHYPMTGQILGAAAHPDSRVFFLSDNSTVWRLDPLGGAATRILDVESLGKLPPVGPAGLPQLSLLTADPGGRYLWLDTFRHGVFRLDLTTGVPEQVQLDAKDLSECARTTVTPHMQGQAKIAAQTTFLQLERCFGRIGQDGRFQRLRPRIDAGPVADAAGNTWYIADNSFYRIDPAGRETAFAQAQDTLGNAQVKALDVAGGKLRVSSYRSPLALFDLDKRSWSHDPDGAAPEARKGAGRRQAPDPDDPDLSWRINGDGVYLQRGRKTVQRWPARLADGTLTVTRNGGTTAWIATNTGLVEFPIAESLEALGEQGIP